MNSIDRTLSKLPYVRMMFSDKEMQKINNKFDMFSDSSVTKEKQIQRLSKVNQFDHESEYNAAGGGMIPMYYHQLMNGISTNDKKRRMIDYRTMASYSEVASAIREICDEMFVKDDLGEVVKCKLRGDYNEEIKTLIQKEFQQHLNIFKIRERGWGYVHDHIVEGELVFENIVSLQKPHMGILGLTRIAAERIDPLYYDLDNELIDSFILRAKQQDQYPYQWGKSSLGQYNTENQQRLIFLNDQQVTYIHNTKWEESAKKYKLPHLAEAHRAYRQLSLIEDATIIYMLVRAPQRLVFNIDTGNLPASKAEQYIQRLMAKFWTKKAVNANGQVENTYDPQGMLENYYFPKTRDGAGSSVDVLQGGDASPDNMEVLNYFVQKLYQSLHVPLSRLNSDTAFADGENITREELRFARFIISVQEQWASAIKKTFITHLKLKGKKILEVANKLNIKEIDVEENGAKTKVQMANIFAKESSEYFTNKCWDYLHFLDKAINEKLEQVEIPLRKSKVFLENKWDKIDKEIDVLTEQLKNESESTDLMINESVENIKLQLDMNTKECDSIFLQLEKVDEQIDQLKEMKDDNSSWWEQYDLKEEDLDIAMNKPTQFFTIREQQIFQQKLDNYNNMTANDMVDNIFMQKECLGWDDQKIMVNMELMRKTAALRWELANIEQNGPDFREKALKEMQGAGAGEDLDLSGLGGGSLPSPSGGGGDSLPSMGDAPESPGEGNATLPSAPTSDSQNNGPSKPTGESVSRMKISAMASFNKEQFTDDLKTLLESVEVESIYK